MAKEFKVNILNLSGKRISIDPNNTSEYLRRDGSWSTPSGGSGSLDPSRTGQFITTTDSRSLTLAGSAAPITKLDIGGYGVLHINGTQAYQMANRDSDGIQVLHTGQTFINLITSNDVNEQPIGGVYFSRTAGQADAHRNVAGIRAIQTGVGNLAGAQLQFFVKNVGSATALRAPIVVIDENSNVGIRKTGDYPLDVAGQINGTAISVNGTPVIITTDTGQFAPRGLTGTAAGLNKQIQFNSNGYLAGNNNLVYDVNNNYFGLGTSAPSYLFHSKKTETSANGTLGANIFEYTISPSGDTAYQAGTYQSNRAWTTVNTNNRINTDVNGWHGAGGYFSDINFTNSSTGQGVVDVAAAYTARGGIFPNGNIKVTRFAYYDTLPTYGSTGELTYVYGLRLRRMKPINGSLNTTSYAIAQEYTGDFNYFAGAASFGVTPNPNYQVYVAKTYTGPLERNSIPCYIQGVVNDVTSQSTYMTCPLYVSAEKNGTGTNSSPIGLRGAQIQVVNNAAGTINESAGIFLYTSNNNNGTISNATNLYLYNTSNNVSSPIGNMYGIRIGRMCAVGTTKGYGIYQEYTGDVNVFYGDVGLGITSPSAALHIAAGSAINGTAPIKLSSGSLLSVAEAGAIEYNGSDFYVTNNAGNRQPIFTGIPTASTGAFVDDGTFVRTTGNQTITGIKTFPTDSLIAGNIRSTGNRSVDLDFSVLNNIDGPTLNWNYGWLLRPSTNSYVMDWENFLLMDNDELHSIDWNSRILLDSMVDPSVNWQTRNLVGNWTATNGLNVSGALSINGQPILSGSGNFVTTNTAQTITESKIFNSSSISSTPITLQSVSGQTGHLLLTKNIDNKVAAFINNSGTRFTVNANNAGGLTTIGGLPGSESTYAGMWLAQSSPSASNYILLGGNNQAFINAPSLDVEFRIANTTRAAVGPNGLAVGLPTNKAPMFPFHTTGANVNFIITASGRVGVNVHPPTATLHISGGRSVAASAPIKIESGQLLATPEAGAIEYNGTGLYFTNHQNIRAPIYTGTVALSTGILLSGIIPSVDIPDTTRFTVDWRSGLCFDYHLTGDNSINSEDYYVFMTGSRDGQTIKLAITNTGLLIGSWHWTGERIFWENNSPGSMTQGGAQDWPITTIFEFTRIMDRIYGKYSYTDCYFLPPS